MPSARFPAPVRTLTSTLPDPGPPVAALHAYEHALTTHTPLHAHYRDGRSHPVDVARWLAPADAADATALARADGPTLDVGCGPGRILAALAGRGVPALGVDLSAVAVRIARERGCAALRRDVFARLPGEGRWGSALLLDGNIGIGGDPQRLLIRMRDLVGTGGRVIVETHADPGADESALMGLSRHARTATGGHFRWANVGVVALARHAAAAGLQVAERWTDGGRGFALLLHTA